MKFETGWKVRTFWVMLAVSAVSSCATPVQVRLEQATYIGGGDFDRAQGCAIDDAGFVYIAGNTKSKDLPVTPGVVQPGFGGVQDAFVAKFSPDLKRLMALSYLGGTGEDRGYGVNVDADGNIYLSGITKSPSFPTTAGAFDRTFSGGVDVFLAKFSHDLKELHFSTLLGGSEPDSKLTPDWNRGGIGLDHQNNIYIPGRTSGPDFPVTPNAYATSMQGGMHDAFVTRFSSDGSDLEWSTLIGGSGGESFHGNLILHHDGSVYVAGVSNSVDYPVTSRAYDKMLSGSGYRWWDGEGVVSRFNADASALIYSTYLWGPVTLNDGLAVDKEGRAHVVANVTPARAGDVPVSAGVAQPAYGGGRFDMTVAILSEEGAQVERASFLGGQGIEEGAGIALDNAGNIFVGGFTTSEDFPVTSGSSVVQPGSGGGLDAVFAVLDRQLALQYSTYLGGQGEDNIRCIAYGGHNTVVVSGSTDGGFPGVSGGYDALHNGGRDGFAAIFSGPDNRR